MTRVLHVTDCYLPRPGGIEVHVSDLASRQRAAGLDARIITVTPAAGDPEHDEAVVRAGRPPGRPAGTISVLAASAELRDLLDAWDPDVVHVHISVFSPFSTLAARHASSRGFPTLVTVHSMWSRLGPLPGVARTLLRLRRWPLTWTAVSDAAAEPLRQMLGPDIQVTVLPNAVEPTHWCPAAPSSETDGQPPTLLSVMRFTRTKRALPLARMLLHTRRIVPVSTAFRAVVVGDGPEHGDFARFVRRQRMDAWVELPGRVDRADVRGHLAHAAAFVAPAWMESFGIAALEARAAGVPVIASGRSGVGEFIRHGREGLLAADDQQMANAMARMVTDTALRTAIAEHNRTHAIDHTWEAALALTSEMYAQARVRSPARGTRTRAASPAPRLGVSG